MADLLEKTGEKVNLDKLSEKLGCPVVSISALKGTGIKKAAEKAVELAEAKQSVSVVHEFAASVESAISSVEDKLGSDVSEEQKRFFAIKVLEKDDKIKEQLSSVPDVTLTKDIHTSHQLLMNAVQERKEPRSFRSQIRLIRLLQTVSRLSRFSLL